MTARPRILIVDDDAEISSYMRELLESRDYEVRVVPDGADAIRETHRCRIDLVLMDIRMRTLSGIWFCKALKEKAQTRNIPVVMVSAYSDDESRQKAFSAGADGFLPKPFRSEDLLAIIRRKLAA